MTFVNMQIMHRVKDFSKLVSDTVCTDCHQNKMGLEVAMKDLLGHLQQLHERQNTLYIIGNGGSAAVASHALVDFVNVAKISTHVLHEPALHTCMANDFGYERAYSHVVSQFIKLNDILIAISSSGQSLNICTAAKVAKDRGARLITLTGFHDNNALRQLGDLNFWLNSCDYGYVEIGHQFILHNLSDRIGEQNKVMKQEHCVEIV